MIDTFSRSTQIELPLEGRRIWEFLHDERSMAECSQHIHDVQMTSPGGAWSAVLTSRIGRFTVSAPLTVTIVEEELGEWLSVEARGHDRKVGTRLHVTAVLRRENGDPEAGTEAGSRLHLEGCYEVTGKVANLGSGIVRRHAESMVEDFWTTFTSRVIAHARSV